MADTCSHFARHRIELVMIASDIERGIGIASDQEGADFQAHGFVREEPPGSPVHPPACFLGFPRGRRRFDQPFPAAQFPLLGEVGRPMGRYR